MYKSLYMGKVYIYNIYIYSFTWISPHVRESKTVLDSGFHPVDFGFGVLDSGFRIPDSSSVDSGFQKGLDSNFFFLF